MVSLGLTGGGHPGDVAGVGAARAGRRARFRRADLGPRASPWPSSWTSSSSCGCCAWCRRSRYPLRRLLPGALFGAAGFEALKLLGGYYLTLISGSVTASAFGGAVGLLVWINLLARFAFFTAAWTATLRRSRRRLLRRRTPSRSPPGPTGTAVAGRAGRTAGGCGRRGRQRRSGRRAPATGRAARRGRRRGAARPGRAAATPPGGAPAVRAPPSAAAVGRRGCRAETRTPTPAVPAGTEKPQSSSRAAWSAARRGVLSVSMTLTTSRRPSRSAAVTNVCRAASVKPVFPPRSPG